MLAAFAPTIETLGHYYRWRAADQELDATNWLAEVHKLPLVQNREVAIAAARGLNQTLDEYLQDLADKQKKKAKAALNAHYENVLFFPSEESVEEKKKQMEQRAASIARYQGDAKLLAAEIRKSKLDAAGKEEVDAKDWRFKLKPMSSFDRNQ